MRTEELRALKPVLTVRNTNNHDARVVFSFGRGVFAVVKFIGEAPSVKSVKFWAGTSIEKTASYWNTDTPFDADEQTVNHAIAALEGVRSLFY